MHDLIGALGAPGEEGVFSVFRFVLRYFQRLRGRSWTGLRVVAALFLVSIVGNAFTYWYFDAGVAGKTVIIGDALWYSLISITTIGYGDQVAESTGARLGTVFFIIVMGLVTVTMIVGILAELITYNVLRGERGMAQIHSTDHILIVNFPSRARLLQIIRELRHDARHATRDIVLVTDDLETLPIAEDHVLFVQGSPLEQQTYDQANIAEARMAIVLAPSYGDPTSDALVASAVSIIESVNSNVFTVAECMEETHRRLFEATNCNSVVYGLQIAGNLVVQESNDPGVAQAVGTLTSNLRGGTLFSAVVEQPIENADYNALARGLLDHGANLLAVNRQRETFTTFKDIDPQAGDHVVYIGSRRLTWPELLQCTQKEVRQVNGKP